MESKSLKDLNRKLSRIGKALVKAGADISDDATRQLAIGANEIRNTIIQSMARGKKTGRWYRKKGGKRHRASAPGEAPAVDTGELMSRIIYDVRELEMEVEVGAEAGAPYAVYLEEGTDRMGARPWLTPAVERHQEDIVKNVGDAAFDVIQKGFQKGMGGV